MVSMIENSKVAVLRDTITKAQQAEIEQDAGNFRKLKALNFYSSL